MNFPIHLRLRARIEVIRGQRHKAKLSKSLPGILDEHNKSIDVLRPVYDRYIATTSTDNMAASLGTAAFLRAICMIRRPKVAVDLGSGFSSYVLREFSAQNECRVISVDDDNDWAEKTREFLRSENISDEGVESWDQFDSSSVSPDLIFFDIGTVTFRREIIQQVIDRLNATGALLVDDVHRASYRSNVNKVLRSNNMKHYSNRSIIVDSFGRYSEYAEFK